MSLFPKRKTRATEKSKKSTKPKVKVILDSNIESIISKKSDYCKMTVTEQVQMDEPLSSKIQLLIEKEALLISDKVLPLPSSLIQELLNGHDLSEDIKKGLQEQGKSTLFPLYKINDLENAILFLNNLVSSQHQIGQKIAELAKEVKSKSDTDFEHELDQLVKFLISYKNNTLNYKNLFCVDLLKLNNLFSKLGTYRGEYVVPAIISAFWVITVFYDKNVIENVQDFKNLLDFLLEKGNTIIQIDQNTAYDLFSNLNTEEILVDSNLFPLISKCIFHPYIKDFKVEYLDVFPCAAKFDITQFIEINEAPIVSAPDLPPLIDSSLRQKTVQFGPPPYTSNDALNVYTPVSQNRPLNYGDNISLQIDDQIDALLPQQNIYTTASINSHSGSTQGGASSLYNATSQGNATNSNFTPYTRNFDSSGDPPGDPDDNDPDRPPSRTNGPNFNAPRGRGNSNQRVPTQKPFVPNPKERIAIINSFDSLKKFSDIDAPYVIYRHIKNFCRHYKLINISGYSINFQILVLLQTFSGPAKAILEPLQNSDHPAYKCRNINQVLKIIKEIFCSQFQRQSLKKTYDSYILKDNNFRIFYTKKMDLFNASRDIFEIPAHDHNPPLSYNQLFQDFKLDFIDSISSNLDFFKDLTKIVVQITNLTILSNLVENSEKTYSMLKSKYKNFQNGQVKQFQKKTTGAKFKCKSKWEAK